MSDSRTSDRSARGPDDDVTRMRIPPSFTPQGVSGRPGADDAIPVGDTGERPRTLPGTAPNRGALANAETPGVGVPGVGGAHRIGRPEGSDGARSEPRIRRQSSREVPVSGQRNNPPPVPPRRSGMPARSEQGAPPRSIPPRSTPPGGGQPPQSIPPGRPVRASAGPVRPTPVRSAPRPPAGGGRGGGNRGAALGSGGRGGGNIRIRKGRVAGVIAVLVLLAVLAWPVGLLIWANGKIQHVEALSGAENTAGTTYLIAGSDARGSGGIDDSTSGARTDTIMLLHKPSSGPVALISIPRDTYAEMPDGSGSNKINAAYSYGGAPMLVKAVETLSGLTVDHYVEVGFGGVSGVVDAVGGVRLCLDYDVHDVKSKLDWKKGCHVADGKTALAFSRMRYADPKGDIGRAERQQQVIGQIGKKVADPAVLLNPATQVGLADAGLAAVVTDTDSGVIDIAMLALAFRSANGDDGVTGTPPIATVGYRTSSGASAVLLDENQSGEFWTKVRDGEFSAGQKVGGMPGS